MSIQAFVPFSQHIPCNRHEHRYFEECVGADGTNRLRSCIENTLTGARRFELVEAFQDGKLHAPLLVQCLDRGSKGQVYAQWTLVGPPKLRTVVVYDPWHRIDGHVGETYQDTDTHFAKLESAVAYEAFRGPWLGNANYQIGQGANRDFHKRMTKENNLIYEWCYEIICMYRGVDLALIGDEDHKTQLLAELASADPFSKLDTRMKLGRWNAYHDKHSTYRPHRVVVMMVLISYGIRKQWWKSFADSPLCKIVMDRLDIETLEDDDDDKPPVRKEEYDDCDGPSAEPARGSRDPPPPAVKKPRGVQASNEELRKVRSAYTSVLHYQTMLFADFHKFRKLDAVHGLNDPIVVEFKKTDHLVQNNRRLAAAIHRQCMRALDERAR